MKIRTIITLIFGVEAALIGLSVGPPAPLQMSAERQAPPDGDRRRQAAADDKDHCFHRTRVIGYSQVGSPRAGGWFVAGDVFESIVGDDRWELLWAGGAGVDRWRDPEYQGWSRSLVSRCPGDEPPDRVLLSISGPYGGDEKAWAEAIGATVENIRKKIPSARQIVLQPVVGGPEGKPCPVPGRPGGRVRASWQHQHIENALREVVGQYAEADVQVVAGVSPRVRTCEDYADALGHLTSEGAKAAGRAIGEYYARRDAECREQGHSRCGKGRVSADTAVQKGGSPRASQLTQRKKADARDALSYPPALPDGQDVNLSIARESDP